MHVGPLSHRIGNGSPWSAKYDATAALVKAWIAELLLLFIREQEAFQTNVYFLFSKNKIFIDEKKKNTNRRMLLFLISKGKGQQYIIVPKVTTKIWAIFTCRGSHTSRARKSLPAFNSVESALYWRLGLIFPQNGPCGHRRNPTPMYYGNTFLQRLHIYVW